MHQNDLEKIHRSQLVCMRSVGALFLIFSILLVSLSYIFYFLKSPDRVVNLMMFAVFTGLFLLFYLALMIRRTFSQSRFLFYAALKRSTIGASIGNDLGRALRSVFSEYENQSKGVVSAVTTVEEITAVLSEVAKSTELTLLKSVETQASANNGLLSVQRLQSAMSEIEAANVQIEGMHNIIKSIGDNTSIINDIVFRTQMLSFNAAIEAARAGQHGLGFSVVASEIGKLSQSVGEAADGISKLLEQSQLNANNSVHSIRQRITGGKIASDECAAAFSKIHANINEVAPMIEMIKATAEMQESALLSTKSAFEDIRTFHEKVGAVHPSVEAGLAQLALYNQKSLEPIDQNNESTDHSSSDIEYKETA